LNCVSKFRLTGGGSRTIGPSRSTPTNDDGTGAVARCAAVRE
jgi:hypothetical protein